MRSRFFSGDKSKTVAPIIELYSEYVSFFVLRSGHLLGRPSGDTACVALLYTRAAGFLLVPSLSWIGFCSLYAICWCRHNPCSEAPVRGDEAGEVGVGEAGVGAEVAGLFLEWRGDTRSARRPPRRAQGATVAPRPCRRGRLPAGEPRRPSREPILASGRSRRRGSVGAGLFCRARMCCRAFVKMRNKNHENATTRPIGRRKGKA